MWWVCFQCSERRTFTFLNGSTSLKTNKKILGNRHCPYFKCLWNAKSGVSAQFRRRGMRPAGGQRATDTFTLLSSILCLINFFELFWFDSVGSIQSIPTTRDASGWRSLPDWLIFYQIHWFWWQGIRLSDGHLAIDNFTLLSSMLCFIDLFWFDSVGSIQSLQVISMARKWVWLTLFSYSCYVCLRNFLLGVNLCLKTQS